MKTSRTFYGASLTEQPDGSAILLVRTARGEPLVIHLAPHVYLDIGYQCYQQFSQTRAGNRAKLDWEKRQREKRTA